MPRKAIVSTVVTPTRTRPQQRNIYALQRMTMDAKEGWKEGNKEGGKEGRRKERKEKKMEGIWKRSSRVWRRWRRRYEEKEEDVEDKEIWMTTIIRWR